MASSIRSPCPARPGPLARVCQARIWRSIQISSAIASSTSATPSRLTRRPAAAPQGRVVLPPALQPRRLRLPLPPQLRLPLSPQLHLPLPPQCRLALAPLCRQPLVPQGRALPDEALGPAEDEAAVVGAVSQRPWQWRAQSGTARGSPT